MATPFRSVIDAQQRPFHTSYSPADLGASGGDWSVRCARLEGGLSHGVEIVEVSNGKLKFTVVPTRGMGLWKAALGDWSIGWNSPVRGPVHPAFVDLGEPSGLGWLDGFDELLVRCGLESNGAPEFDDATGRLKYPLHGRIANKPASEVSVGYDRQTDEIVVRGVVTESRFHFLNLRLTSTYHSKVGSSEIHVHDEIENCSAQDCEIQLLYHINFGDPLLEAGSRVVGPFKTVIPRNAHAAKGIDSWDSYLAPQPGFAEQVYFTDLLATESTGTKPGKNAAPTRVLLKSAQGNRGVSVVYDTQQLPCFSLWKDTGALNDGYVTGLEPGTNYPNPRSFEGKRQRVVKLAPGEKTPFDLTLELHNTSAAVQQSEQAIAKIAAGRTAQIHQQPLADWCSP